MNQHRVEVVIIRNNGTTPERYPFLCLDDAEEFMESFIGRWGTTGNTSETTIELIDIRQRLRLPAKGA